MADNSILTFRCTNPECAKPIKLRRPQKSGVYPVTCPHCQVKKNLKISGLDAFESEQSEKTDNSAKPVIEIKEDFITGEQIKFLCPHCQEHEIEGKPEKPGKVTATCPECKGKVIFSTRPKTDVIEIEKVVNLIKGKLVMLRRGWLNKDYPLGIGTFTVGRQDSMEPSDISIKNDNSVSRRSVRIDVSQTARGYMFKMTVMRATNPVIHNGTPLEIGESVLLNFGDTIVLGQTRFRFDKDQ